MNVAQASLPQAAPAHFRWQYLHVVGVAATANAVLHETDIFGFGDSPYVSVCHDVMGAAAHARRMAPGLAYGPWEVRHPIGSVRATQPEQSLDVNAGKLGLRGRIRPRPNSDIGGFTTTLLERGGKRSYWQVLSVGARFEGVAEADSVSAPLSGAFYMDRQWGDLPLQSIVDEWVWGHFVGADLEVVYFDVRTRDGARSVRALLRDGPSWQVASLQSSYLGRMRTASLAGMEASLQLGVATARGNVEIQFDLSPPSLLRVRQDEAHPDFAASYARWRVTGHATTANGARPPLVGLTEYLGIQPIGRATRLLVSK